MRCAHIVPTSGSIGVVRAAGHGLVPIALEANQIAGAIVVTKVSQMN